MARVDSLGHFLTDVADAIREKGGTSEPIQASDFDTAIENLPSGGNDNNVFVNTLLASTYSYTVGITSLISSIDLIDTNQIVNMRNFLGTSKITTLPLLNTSNVTTMREMLHDCSLLENVPILNTSNVTTMQNMFSSCPNLSDTSLDNILQMCINTTSKYTRTKTLREIGIFSTNYPASRIEALPHYQDFIDAGWTIGY